MKTLDTVTYTFQDLQNWKNSTTPKRPLYNSLEREECKESRSANAERTHVLKALSTGTTQQSSAQVELYSGLPNLAVIGCPIAHSLSPVMHNAALSEISRQNPSFAFWHYYRFHITPEELPQALVHFHQNNFIGLNVTIPHKIAIVPHLQMVEKNAHAIGSVNTLLRIPQGYQGFNTDGYGLEKALQITLNTSLKNATVILLGAGGASKIAAFLSIQSKAKSLWVGNRAPEHLHQLMDTLPASPHTEIRPFNLHDLPKELPKTGLLINATSLGLHTDDPLPINLSHFDSSLKVFDMIYNPFETPLLIEANKRGMACANGLWMLIEQGAQALMTWSHLSEIPINTMYTALQNALKPLVTC